MGRCAGDHVRYTGPHRKGLRHGCDAPLQPQLGGLKEMPMAADLELL